jgi:hypothetical protein
LTRFRLSHAQNPISGIIFDLGGTLAGPKSRVCSAQKENLLRFLRSFPSLRRRSDRESVFDEFQAQRKAFRKRKDRSVECVEQVTAGEVLDSILSKHMETDDELIATAIRQFYLPRVEESR